MSDLVVGWLRQEGIELLGAAPDDGLGDEFRALTARRAALVGQLADGLDPALVAAAQREIDGRLRRVSDASGAGWAVAGGRCCGYCCGSWGGVAGGSVGGAAGCAG